MTGLSCVFFGLVFCLVVATVFCLLVFCHVPVFVMIFNTVVLCFASRVGHIVLLCSLVLTVLL